ncbi:PLD nuclease N-terminal domain-containing protein [Nocardioides jiangxiensis]|uniref:PLD nuclease N-terminal domain-containing protein n=1 Tax=Nocardioides jiangxiensis TaxID=3064524 RepID=A0ABT9AXV3_9ACTN|nr:PLD nuclease N-terminal domain-containing protein [Nocardioides sp. WY-20]MDO7867220.1 PLD nuclease N-terminal domain-containing protein [Nocardioides sp. WY-20]
MTASPLPVAIVTVALAFWAWCLVDLVRTDDRDVRGPAKPMWLAIVLLGSTVGALCWYTLGRPATRRQ